MTVIGPTLAALAVLTGAGLGLATYAAHGADSALGIALGAAAIVAMGLALVLAARPRPLEPLFGGLDRMYVAHKWLGIAALGLIIGHNLVEPDLDRALRETALGEIAEEMGEIALNGFIVLILLSWIRRVPFTRLELPWPLWRFTHRFTGVLFALAAFHQLAIDKPAGIDPALGLYLNGVSVVGLGAWVFTQFTAPVWRPRSMRVAAVDRHGPVTEVTLQPEGGAMRWRPGQFAFVRAPGAGLPEPHPFTIAGAPRADGSVPFAIGRLGDWTGRLPGRLAPGQRVRVEGPYGRFTFRRRVRRQIWLAGGIGITPFLAWAEALGEADRQDIALVWSVRNRTEAFAAERLRAIAGRHPALRVHLHLTAEAGRLTAAGLSACAPFPVREAELFFCGPKGLRDSILAGLKAADQTPRRVHGAAFELR